MIAWAAHRRTLSLGNCEVWYARWMTLCCVFPLRGPPLVHLPVPSPLSANAGRRGIILTYYHSALCWYPPFVCYLNRNLVTGYSCWSAYIHTIHFAFRLLCQSAVCVHCPNGEPVPFFSSFAFCAQVTLLLKKECKYQKESCHYLQDKPEYCEDNILRYKTLWTLKIEIRWW